MGSLHTPVSCSEIRLTPNCSLTPRGAALFFGSVAFGTLLVAGLVASQGFWPVLPFAGLELALLAWALHQSMQRRFHTQTITVSDSEVAVAEVDRQRSYRVVFPRHWAQVKMRDGFSPLQPSRLSIESHGRRCEVGSFLNEQERRGLAQRLRRLIGRTGESPRLEADGPSHPAT
jgi:uncharacterized membrane protein